jgi:RHS repeat-associated protein
VYLGGDHLGSTSIALNSDQSARAKQTYRPYGAVYPAHQEGVLPTDYEFTGQRHEEPGGLYQMGARWYDPYLNRWVQPDTIIPDWYDPQSLNRYTYVSNNPVNHTDPTGHCDPSDCYYLPDGNGGWRIQDKNWVDGSSLEDRYEDEQDQWKATGLTFDDYARAYRAYRYYRAHPVQAATDSFKEAQSGFTMDYTLASIYSEYVLREFFSPYTEAQLHQLMNEARRSGDDRTYLAAAASLVILVGMTDDNGLGPAGSVRRLTSLSDEIADWLGPGARAIKNESGDWIFISKDETRRVRFDFQRTKPHENPHGHVEEKINGKWVRSGQLYPTDVEPK